MREFGCGGRFWAVAAAWLLLATVAHAAESVPATSVEPRLANWVGEDVGICLQIDDLAQRWTDFVESPLARRLHGFPPVAAWRDLHQARLNVLRNEIERRTGANVRDLVKQLFGREVLFAIWPPSDSASGQPAALLLAESTDRTVMQRTLERLVAARRQAGRWRGKRTVEVASETFTINSVMADDDRSAFFLTSADDVAMIATSEALLVSALERRAATGTTDSHTSSAPGALSLASSPAYLAASERLGTGAVARLFVNPRAWDTALECDLKTKKPDSEEARSQAVLIAAWRETEYVAGALRFAPQLGAELAWRWRAEDLPEPVREVAASLAGRSELFDVLPANALVAFVAHADVSRLVRHMIAGQWQQLAEATSAAAASNRPDQNGNILVWALSAGLGPDWVGYLMPPDHELSAEDAPAPVDLVLGVQTRPLEPDGDRPAFALSIEPLLHALSSAAAEAANRQAGTQVASVKSFESAGPANAQRRITVASGIVPGRPKQDVAYCVDDKDRFWVSSSASCLAQASVEGRERLVDDSAIRVALGREGKPSGLVYVNLAGWRKLAAKGRSSVDFLWQGKDLDDRAKDQQYQELLALLQLVDRLLFTSHIDGSTVHLALTISADGGLSPRGRD